MPRARRRQATAEIIQFADLKARHATRRADVRAVINVDSKGGLTGAAKAGDIMLCETVTGRHVLALVERADANGDFFVTWPHADKLRRTVGRVVLVDDVRGD